MRTWLELACAHGLELPGAAGALRREVDALEARLAPYRPAFCHNDLMPGNLIETEERLWLIDWEYAGIGHPLFDELPPHRDPPPGPRFPEAPPVVGLLPGSRRSIASANFPRLLEVAKSVLQRFPKVRFHIPTTAATNQVVRAAIDAGLPPGPTT